MTSDNWSNLLYPKQAPLLWTVSVLTAVCLLAFLHLTHNPRQQQDVHGELLASSLAGLSVQAFVTHDRIALGLLSNRIAELPDVRGVTITAADDTPLAQTASDAQGSVYRAAVHLDDAVVGFVAVTLAPSNSDGVPNWRHWVFGLTLALIMPMLLQLLRGLLPPKPVQQPVSVEFTRPKTQQCFVITANLFDEMRLTTAAQQSAQQQALAWAEDIAMLYNGHASALPHGTVTLHFDDHGEDDRCFAALCAGYLWSDCLRLGDLPGAYRLSGHVLTPEQLQDDTMLAEALLLAAAAQDCELVISDCLLAALKRPDRVRMSPLQHPLHQDLQTTGGSLHRVLGLASRYAVLLSRQLERLNRQPESTERLSTF